MHENVEYRNSIFEFDPITIFAQLFHYAIIGNYITMVIFITIVEISREYVDFIIRIIIIMQLNINTQIAIS